MLSHPTALETNNIFEPKGTMRGHKRAKLTHFTAIEFVALALFSVSSFSYSPLQEMHCPFAM